MVTRRHLVVLAFTLLASAGNAHAAPAPVTPEEVTRNYVAAMKQLRFKDMAARMHPETLKSMRGKLMATVDYLGRSGPPEAMLPMFHGVRSMAELKKLDDRGFFAAFMAGLTRLRPAVKQQLASMIYEPVGHVMQGPNVAHVVCRATQLEEGKWAAGVTPISLKRLGNGWAVLHSADLEGYVTDAKRRQFAGKELISRGQIEAYGHVREGREAHIVFRSTAGQRGERVTRVYAFSLPEGDVEWDTVIGGNLDALATLISTRLQEMEARK